MQKQMRKRGEWGDAYVLKVEFHLTDLRVERFDLSLLQLIESERENVTTLETESLT